ncbi:F-box/FBD/LRR-repeat protein At4g26340-like [Neltuma alba]|uniref:F-box/FBD/LRR-repeat protein At4g26340-like n=1 Tax=Neltuma alba TaxID=207710 RepID=UPI0010A464D5|nr:F-box/FBD/LRR-repeat protein At4g26340-like [Prosopis alba]
MKRIASKKRNKRRRRISDLPEPLLVHILSFLPIKEAVATSLLSKRWRTLWRSLPKLEFDDRNFGSLEFFVQFVDAALHLAHFNSVQMFILKCRHFRLPPVKANIWVNTMISHNLTHLELNALRPVKLPSSIFICNTLRVLKLTGVGATNLSRVNLPLLEVLHLRMTKFSNFEAVRRLLSSCVRLEELVVTDLVIHSRHNNASNEHSRHDIARFEHLLSVDVDVPNKIFPIKAFSNVQFLTLRKAVDTFGYLFDDCPTFPSVIRLQIEKSGCIDCSVLSMLRGFPKLQGLIIHEVDNDWDDDDDSDLMELSTPDVHVPPCVSSQLKEFALFGFEGSKIEFEIVRYVMEKATVLRTVIVGSDGTCESKEEDFQMLKELSSYPRCSASCRLIYDAFGENIEEVMRKFSTIGKLTAASF